MNKEQTLALFAKGKDEWNKWANGMLAERKMLEAMGEWSDQINQQNGVIEGLNDKTNDWLERATADFEHHPFATDAEFREYVFPGNTDLYRATFSEDVNFNDAKFNSSAVFIQTIFKGSAYFNNVNLTETIVFGAAEFQGRAEFHHAIFRKSAIFGAINSKGRFSLLRAVFHEVPDFKQAHFQEAPVLDFVDFRDSYDRPASSVRPQSDATTSALWRALKRLAIQGHDHEREQLFFANEIVTRRGFEDHAFGKGMGRYWLGWIYQALSDFGRSTLRPFLWWLLANNLFGLLYREYHLSLTQFPLGASECVDGGGGEPGAAALHLSLAKGLVVPGIAGSEKTDQDYACLFGRIGDKPVIPMDIAFLGVGQSLFSAVLIFLILLAIRNRFRIK